MSGIVAEVSFTNGLCKEKAHFLSEDSNCKNQVIHQTKPGWHYRHSLTKKSCPGAFTTLKWEHSDDSEAR